MAAVTASASREGSFHNRSVGFEAVDGGRPRFKVGYLETAATVDATDVIAVDVFAEWGITKVLAIREYVHTTTDSVVAEETLVTTAITGTVLAVTVPAGSDNDVRILEVYGI